jgi:hypothetical protein
MPDYSSYGLGNVRLCSWAIERLNLRENGRTTLVKIDAEPNQAMAWKALNRYLETPRPRAPCYVASYHGWWLVNFGFEPHCAQCFTKRKKF